MSKLPSTPNSEILTIRVSQKLKDKLFILAKRSKYNGSASALIRALIEAESKRY